MSKQKLSLVFVSLFDFVFLFKSLAKNPAIIHIHISMYTYYIHYIFFFTLTATLGVFHEALAKKLSSELFALRFVQK